MINYGAIIVQAVIIIPKSNQEGSLLKSTNGPDKPRLFIINVVVKMSKVHSQSR